MLGYEEWRELLRDERLPAAVVDLDAFDRNARKLAGLLAAKGRKLRLATKSVRVPDLIRRTLASSPVFQGLMCYSAEEAAWLSEQGFDDLLVAYPTARVSDLAALRSIHERGARVALVCDGTDGLARADDAMRGAAKPFPLVLDIDASLRLFGGLAHLGVRRSPLRTDADIRNMLAAAAKRRSVRVVGAMAYEAQVAGLGDRNPFKRLLNPAFRLVRSMSVSWVARRRREVANVFHASGTPLEIFNGGGTGSVTYAVEESALTELSAGSGLLCSHLFDYFSNVSFEPACFFALQAARSSDRGYVTCLGGGYIASGEPGWDRVPVPWLPRGAKLVSAEGCGEVQTPVRLPAGASVAIGDPVLFRHAKAGELAERFDEYLLVSGGKITARAKTYRGLHRCFF